MTRVSRSLKIAGTGVYLPRQCLTHLDVDARLGRAAGFSLKLSGPEKRHFAAEETSSQMAAKAAKMALEAAGLHADELDLIISASGLVEQPVPAQAVLLSRYLGPAGKGIPAYDVNATCLSFLAALDLVSDAIAAGRFRNVLIVSSEMPSCGLNWAEPANAVLFGDGAAAAVVRTTESDSGIIASLFETFPEGANLCQVRAGGTGLRLEQDGVLAYSQGEKYEMDGVGAYKLTAKHFPAFLAKLLGQAQLALDDIDLVIPHQASRSALDHLTTALHIPSDKIVDIFATHGNQVAASIPSALHQAQVAGRIRPGMHVLLAGTAAGLTFGGLVMRF